MSITRHYPQDDFMMMPAPLSRVNLVALTKPRLGRLLREDRFPRVWVPDPENRDLRQMLWHRHRLVQMRTRVMNQLQAIAMNEGVRVRKKLWSKPRKKSTRQSRHHQSCPITALSGMWTSGWVVIRRSPVGRG
jgi:hypothetical protein